MRSWSSLCNHSPEGGLPCNDADFDDKLVHLCNHASLTVPLFSIVKSASIAVESSCCPGKIRYFSEQQGFTSGHAFPYLSPYVRITYGVEDCIWALSWKGEGCPPQTGPVTQA